MPTYTVSDAAAQLPTLLHRIENENLLVNICVRDAENIVAFLVSARDFGGLDVTPTVSVSEARKTFNAMVRTAHERDDVTAVITRHRKPIAVLSGVHHPDVTIDERAAFPAAVSEPVRDRSPVSLPVRASATARRTLTVPEMTAAIQARFPSGNREWGRVDHTRASELMYRIFGPVCLLGNHTTYRPVIECAHLTDWPATIAAFCADDWNRHMVEQVACYEDPPPSTVRYLYEALGERFNEIWNVVPLCKQHHARYDGRGRGSRITTPVLVERRDEVLLLPPVALNVMRELEAACYGRRTVDADKRPIVERNVADPDMYTLKAWAARAWQHGAYGDVDPVVCIGSWAMDLSDGRMESRGRYEETPKFWWTGWR